MRFEKWELKNLDGEMEWVEASFGNGVGGDSV